MTGWVAVLCAAGAAGLVLPARQRLVGSRADVASSPASGWMLRLRLLWSLLAGLGAATFVQGRAGPVVGVVAGVAAWVLIGRTEQPEARRAREDVRRELPHLVDLFAATLRAGAAPGDGLAVVCAALPGAAADRLGSISARLALGIDPVQVWESLGGDPDLAPLGRTLGRAQATGASVVLSVERLADELSGRARADVEERAKAVGVKAALPLGLCLLPAFILIGIVPVVAGLLGTLAL